MEFQETYDTFYRPVRSYIARMVQSDWTAEDLAQETFLKVQRKIDTLSDPAKLKPWLFSIARNVCLDHFRRTAASKGEGADSGILTDLAPLSVQTELERSEMSGCVREKIDLLPESHREVLILGDITDLTCREIADVLGISPGTAKVRLHRARKALKKILEKECVFERDERNVMVCLPNVPDSRIKQ